MDTDKTTLTSSCPTTEQLSEYTDCPGDIAISQHIAQCPKCQKIVLGYQKLSDLLDEYQPAPLDLEAKIKAACHQAAAEDEAERLFQSTIPAAAAPKKRSIVWWRVLGNAATLVVAGVIGAMLANRWDGSRQGADSSSEMASADRHAPIVSHAFAATPAPVATNSGFSLEESRRLAAQRGDTRETPSVDHLQNVSTSSGSTKHTQSKKRRTYLNDSVTQVWINKGAGDVSSVLNKLSKANPKLIQEVSSPDELGIITIKMRTSDQEVQQLVDNLHKVNKWQLLSPVYPQPGQGDKLAFVNHPVNYTIKLIQE